MKIGLYGGTFNPLHIGHIGMAKNALDKLGLDKVWLIPNKTPPNKKKTKLISSEHKYNICKIAADKYDFLDVCDFELKREGINWTYLTVEGLHEMYPEYELYFIIGADTLFKFDRWKKVENICRIAKIIVLNRKGFDSNKMKAEAERLENKFNTKFYLVDTDNIDVSSTEIRNGQKHELLLPEIREYIEKNKLYD